MAVKISKKIAESLGMEIPIDDALAEANEEMRALTAVKPHEIVPVDNPSLPDMVDIDTKLAEGEKQLEELIINGLSQMTTMFKKSEDASPDKVARYLEVAQQFMLQTLTAIKHKNTLQLEKKKLRMVEHSYKPENSDGNTVTETNNLFIGSREDAMALIEKRMNP